MDGVSGIGLSDDQKTYLTSYPKWFSGVSLFDD